MSPLRVAFQGESGAYSEEAARRRFVGRELRPLPCRTFAEVGAAVESGRARYGLLPVENSRSGSVLQAYDVLAESRIHVVGETRHPIIHMLLGVPGADPAKLRQVRTHPVALAQCAVFLSERPELEAVAVYDTAGAARAVAEAGDREVAAIASSGAAESYGLEVLERGIQDRSDNVTRFYVVSADADDALVGEFDGPAAGALKTVLTFEVAHEPGALLRALEVLARRGVNLTKLESRPLARPWTYRFFVEAETEDRSSIDGALAEMSGAARALRVIGTFPAPAAAAAPAGGHEAERAV